ncbi:hypothetical protein [Cupriavidus consociatus]|uniref:hypothetical protein n=1 Tax=Cupriavidus consociatus TaxID=2821357 RepID=UPI001AE72FC5|nr:MULTISPECIES: hypothetical protein [unclassified Cupriavidus]MBP0625437.1 hypothetical protein [Cupriavidus sp. LEh25]MDK2662181.1 hypothetical protein [Cupriavidus sp. LEh21]
MLPYAQKRWQRYIAECEMGARGLKPFVPFPLEAYPFLRIVRGTSVLLVPVGSRRDDYLDGTQFIGCKAKWHDPFIRMYYNIRCGVESEYLAE